MNSPYDCIPQRILDGLSRYIKDHIPTGHFLHAVLTNDLTEAVGRADDECILALPAIVKWLYNEAPGTCWGSPEKVKQWLATPPRIPGLSASGLLIHAELTVSLPMTLEPPHQD